MKLYMPTALALLLADSTAAVECGKWYSTACLGDTDHRFDPTFTISLIDQNKKWSHLQGYWKSSVQKFDAKFQPLQPKVFNPVDTRKSRGLPYTDSSSTNYFNFKFDGSRLTETVVQIYPPAPQEFCDTAQAAMEPGDLLVLKNGTCGETGYVVSSASYYTSNHEKNGNLRLVGGYSDLLAFSQFFPANDGIGYTVGEDALYFDQEWTMGGGTLASSQIFTFTNANKTKAAGSSNTYNTLFDEYFLISISRGAYEKISEEEFIDSMQKEFEVQNVPNDIRPTIPLNCDGGVCPSEDDWCTHDPSCSISPYQEPEASMNGGVVGGVVAACAVLIFLAGIAYYRMKLAKEEKRVRQRVAVTVAKNLSFSVSTNEITQESIMKEFKDMDSSGDGILQKSEVKAYFMGKGSGVKSSRNLMDSGSYENISDQDFEVIFAILDADGSGTVSFVEFVTFLNECKDELVKSGAGQV